MKYKVRVLKMGEHYVPGPEVFWMSEWNAWETLYFWMVLVQGGGKTIVINTGLPEDLTLRNKFLNEFGGERCIMKASEEERPWKALKNVNVDPKEVDYVFITPLQDYTTSNIDIFKKAKICISRKGWIEEIVAPKFKFHVPRELRIPNKILFHLLTEAWDRLYLLEDEEEVLPGIKAFWVGVHHRSSIAISIDTDKGKVIASDCFFKYKNIEENIPIGVMESFEEYVKAYDRIRREADILLPLYDPEVLSRYPNGEIA
ncbi:MAG: hypothetical protein QXX95_05810 [Nitrososphaerales archaeon]